MQDSHSFRRIFCIVITLFFLNDLIASFTTVVGTWVHVQFEHTYPHLRVSMSADMCVCVCMHVFVFVSAVTGAVQDVSTAQCLSGCSSSSR